MFKRIQQDPVERTKLLDEACQVFNELVDFPLPVVAAINGPAVGLGCTMAVLCDLVYIAESAYLADPHVGVGLTAGDGGAPFWPLTMSIVKAKGVVVLRYAHWSWRSGGDRIGQCRGRGRGGPSARHGRRRELAALPSQALQSTKRAVNLHIRRSATAILDYALAAEHQSFDTPEHKAIVERFLGS